MDNDAIELVQKYVDSLDEYFENVPDDRLLAMSMNPVLVTRWFKDIEVIMKEEGLHLLDRAKNLLRKAMKELWGNKLRKRVRQETGPTKIAKTSEESKDESPLERLRRLREIEEEAGQYEEDPIDSAVSAWMN